MNGALNALRRGVVEQLQACGLNAVAAMEPERAARWRGPAVAVALSRVKCAPGGFQDYLGGPDGEELYGRAAEVILTLDIYAPREGGAGACQEAMDVICTELLCRGAAGLTVLELEAGQVEFLEKLGLYRQTARCLCRAWLTVRRGGSGGFVDFMVRGRTR